MASTAGEPLPLTATLLSLYTMYQLQHTSASEGAGTFARVARKGKARNDLYLRSI